MTHVRLREACMRVALANRVPAEGIVIYYAGDKYAVRRALRADCQALCVAVRSDRNRVWFVDPEVVQNAALADGEKSFHTPHFPHFPHFPLFPHWRQPGLLPRNEDRGTCVGNILFPGTPNTLDAGFSDASWHEFLQGRGMAFHGLQTSTTPFASPGRQAQARFWNDMREADVVLAIRPNDRGLIVNTPAWKLFNAWRAGVPAILGPGTGYRELQRSPLDYLEAHDVDSAMRALARLQDEPALYSAMVSPGLSRASEHDDHSTARQWMHLIRGALQPAIADLRWETPQQMHRRRSRQWVVARLKRLVAPLR